MKPDKEGLWEWIDDDGKTQIVNVINVAKELNDVWLRVYYLGGYYNVYDNWIGTKDEDFGISEWPDRWGRYVGILNSIHLEQTYGGNL